MYFDTGLKVENYIYLIEHVSRCLISIYIPSGEIKIEAYLPWKYTERKINMKRELFIKIHKEEHG